MLAQLLPGGCGPPRKFPFWSKALHWPPLCCCTEHLFAGVLAPEVHVLPVPFPSWTEHLSPCWLVFCAEQSVFAPPPSELYALHLDPVPWAEQKPVPPPPPVVIPTEQYA